MGIEPHDVSGHGQFWATRPVFHGCSEVQVHLGELLAVCVSALPSTLPGRRPREPCSPILVWPNRLQHRTAQGSCCRQRSAILLLLWHTTPRDLLILVQVRVLLELLPDFVNGLCFAYSSFRLEQSLE